MPEEDDVALARLRGYPSPGKGAAVYRERRDLGASVAASLIRAGGHPPGGPRTTSGQARSSRLTPRVAASASAKSRSRSAPGFEGRPSCARPRREVPFPPPGPC